MAEQLSIANPKPERLPGAQLLHHMVPYGGEGDDSVNAIESCAENGEIVGLTYSELHRQANCLANRILHATDQHKARQQRQIIPIVIPQSLHLYVSQLASLKAGGAFCPIALDVPEQRLRFILDDVGAKLLLTTAALKPQLPHLEDIEVIVVDESCAQSNSAEPDDLATTQDIAYVMYTSGSTGQPKGVLLSHAAATQALLAHDQHIPAFSRFLQFASPTFDVSVFEIFFPWLRRKTLVSCDRRRMLNDLPAAIAYLRVDAAELTPSVANNLLQGRKSVPSLKLLLTIGEMLKPGIVEEFGGSNDEPGLLHGMYGPTEATIHCTLQTYFPKRMSCGSIGVPLSTVSAFIVKPIAEDEPPPHEVEILPLGAEGELAIGGHQLADGYLNREEQTRKAFVQHPKHGRLYRTGDRARMSPDGKLECLGRISGGQIKLRGQRIELGEIESAVMKSEFCQSAIAEVISGVLIAFCIASNSSFTKSSVLETCREWLPSFMVPGDVVILQSFPYLASGKLDRKTLNNLYLESQEKVEDSEHVTDESLRVILEILNHITSTETKANSSLSALGVDSIAAIRFASELSRRGYPQLDTTYILASQSPLDIRCHMEEVRSQNATTPTGRSQDEREEDNLTERVSELPLVLRHVHAIERTFSCTPVQSAMLAETLKTPELYCNWVEFQVTAGARDLRAALLRLAEQHQLLRSGFVMLSEGEATFATIVWKILLPEQIVEADSVDSGFRIDNEYDLLRPCSFQINTTTNGTRLVLRMHHALYDQWSVDVLRQDLSNLLQGKKLPLPCGFSSVSKYYARFGHSDSPHAASNFWQDNLRNASFSRFPSLIGTREPPGLAYTEWRRTDLQTSKLNSLSRSLGCSAPATFQAALAYLLRCYTGSPDVVLGSVFSGRTIAVPNIDRIFGPCLATLPLRIDVSSVHTRQELLTLITKLNRNVQRHVTTSLSDVKKLAGVSPGSSMFDVLFVWQQSSIEADKAGLVREISSADQHEFNLVLEFDPSADYVRVRSAYRRSVISAEQIDVLCRQLEVVTNEILDDPSQPLDQLGKAWPLSLLSVANPNTATALPPQSLASMLEANAQLVLDLPALTFADEELRLSSINYRQLHSQANRVANAFICFGLLPNDLVCICMEKSIDLYVCILAVVKAGAGYLPLLPETPHARVNSILEQSPVRLCICDSSNSQIFSAHTNTKTVEFQKLSLSNFSNECPQMSPPDSTVAYAVFTSGSTGEPKGVAVTTKNLHSNLAVLTDLYRPKAGDRLLQACSQAFDVSVFEIFFALYNGMTLCSATKDTLFQDLENCVRLFEITHLSLTPTVAALIDPLNVPSVRFLVTAGEGVTESVFRKWADHGLHQGYGPSETTNICTVKMDVSLSDAINNIGQPFRNTSAFVIAPDEDFRILPAGSYGEFAFGGEQVFQGYIARDELNAVKLIDHAQFGRIYRSGDTGRILHDRTLLISGRLDDQVKIRGNRVELGEINAVLMRHEEVSDCTTMITGQSGPDQSLASFIVSVSTAKGSETQVADCKPDMISELFGTLEATLPSYMLPSMLIPMSQLPRTSQGKLDKRLLQTVLNGLEDKDLQKFSRSQDQCSDNEPHGPEEDVMAQKLAEVLGISTVAISRHTSFFALGLNSLSAIRFAKALGIALDDKIKTTDILRNASISRLTRFRQSMVKLTQEAKVEDELEIFPANLLTNIQKDFESHGKEVEAILPCTPLQEAMLSAEGSTGSRAYSNSITLRVNGDINKLFRCWDDVVRRNQILRTTFVETPLASHPYAQVILRTTKVLSSQLGTPESFSSTPKGNRLNTDDSVDPSNPLLIEITASPSSQEMTLRMHHAIYDGISMSNLFLEIESLYHNKSLSSPVPYQPFLKEVATHNGDQSLQFWSARLKNFRPHPFPEVISALGGQHTVQKELKLKPVDLNSFCEQSAITPLSVFQAAWVKVLSCSQALVDVCFGHVVSGRIGSIADVDRLVAPCFNTIPVRMRLDTATSNIELIRHFHQNNLDSLDHQLTALRRTQAMSADPSKHLFDSLLLLQPPPAYLDRTIWEITHESGSMDLPLVIEIVPEQDRIELYLHFSSRFIDKAFANELMLAFDASLSSCIRYSSGSAMRFLDFESSIIAGKLAPETQAGNDGISGDALTSPTDQTGSVTEKLIGDVFAELARIGPSKVSRQTSLYQIGLDSLNAVQIASRLRGHGLSVDAADVMQHRTPAKIALAISGRSGADELESSRVDLDKFDRTYRTKILELTGLNGETVEAVRPCTSAQKGMLAQSLQNERQLYVNHLTYCVPQIFTAAQIERAWARVQQKHQALRMGFCQLEDATNQFVAVIHTMLADNHLQRNIDFRAESLDASEIGTRILQDLHLPAWRINVARTADQDRVMQISLHHAIYDAESLQMLLSDFAKALRGTDLGPSYVVDDALYSALNSAECGRAEGETFWGKALESASYSAFPNLCPRVVTESDLQSLSIVSSYKVSDLHAFCRLHESTVQAVGQSTWGSLLAAYTGNPEVTFGTVFSGHASGPSQNVAFPSVATVPVFCDTTKPPMQVLKDMQSFNVSAQQHRFVPLTDIQRLAGRAGLPLFDTVFVYQKFSSTSDNQFDWELLSESAAVDYSASLELYTTPDGQLRVTLTFDTKIIPVGHGRIILQQYDRLLQNFVQPELDHADLFDGFLSILPAKEDQLPSPVRLLHEFVELGARSHPEKTALEFITSLDERKQRQTWTYQELDAQSNQIAHMLLESGVPPGGVVAVCMPKCAEASLAFAGILKAGCAFLAMDPDLPIARKQFILEDSKTSLVFVNNESDLNINGGIRVMGCRTQDFTTMPTTPANVPVADPSATCYCLYTSGTTGAPKGCELTHENAVQAMMSFQRLFSGHWTEGSRWLQFASYWFDVSVLEQFWSWSVGITVVGAPRDLVLEDLPGFIRRTGITHIDLTPSLARLVQPEDVPSLCNGVFITGGEALKQEIISTWGPHKVICNGYGPTEATIGVTMNRFIGPDAKPSNIGPQFDNVGTLVLKPDSDQPVLQGAVGELCITGKLVGKGYLNRPDQTSKAFPFLKRFGKKAYRTGDLVRMLADGSFSFIGRKDTQAKLRGQRLEIDEIDAVIKTSSEEIAEVASLVIKAEDGSRETLVSFLTRPVICRSELRLEFSSSLRDITRSARQACKHRLPTYMVPTHFVPISRLPLTVNNKIDFKRLAAFFHSLTQKDLQELNGAHTDQRTLSSTEQDIAKALASLVDISQENVSASSNLFSLGLSSISAINFSTILKRAGFHNASVVNIMSNPTVEGLANAISETNEGSRAEQDSAIQAKLSISAFEQRFRPIAASVLSQNSSEIEALAPCTPLQEGLLIESLRSDTRPYFNRFVYENSTSDLPKLEQAVDKLVLSIPMLRTVFLRTDDGYAQIIMNESHSPVRRYFIDFENLVGFLEKQKRNWTQNADQDVLFPFEAFTVQTAHKAYLIFHAHHAIYDGISWSLMMDRLEEIYNTGSLANRGPAFIDALPYGPLCSRPDSKMFWQRRLRNTDFIPLPTLSQSLNTSISSVRMETRYAETSESLRRQLGVSHQALFEASFVAVLHQHFPKTQTFGMVVSGRSIDVEGAESIIGPLFNTIACEVEVTPGDSWSDLLRRCHESNVASVPFQHTPLREVRKFCGRDPSDPIFDILFVFQRQTRSLGSSLLREIEADGQHGYPLALEVELLDDNKVNVSAVADPAVATQKTLTRFASDFCKGLDYITEDAHNQIEQHFQIEDSRRDSSKKPHRSGRVEINGHTEGDWTDSALEIRKIVAQLAGCESEDITPSTAMFTLGLDSIDAVKLSSRLKKRGLSIPVSRVLQVQTIAKMAEAVDGVKSHNVIPKVASRLGDLESQLQLLQNHWFSQDGLRVERVLPASPGQEALIAEMLRSSFRDYYNHDVLRLHVGLDLDRFKAAWQEVVDASPILRTSFVQVTDAQIESVFAQVVYGPYKLRIDHLTIESLDQLPHILFSIQDDAEKSFGRQPALRLTTLSIDTTHYLILSLPHAQYDGHSLALIHEDVTRAYHGNHKARPSYDAVLDECLTAATEDALKFWRSSLADVTLSHLTPRGETDHGSSVYRAEQICCTTLEHARTWCRNLGISMQTLAQTTWAIVLSSYVHHLEVIFGVVLACRDSEEAEQVLFPTMNTVPLKILLHGSGKQMLRYTQSRMNDLLPYQRTPLRAIQKAWAAIKDHVDASETGNLFDTLFIYQQRPDTDDTQQLLYESEQGSSSIDYPIAAELEAVNDHLTVRAACKSSVMDRLGTEELLRRYDRVLSTLLERSDEAIVKFLDGTVSVCGMPAFQLRSYKHDKLANGNSSLTNGTTYVKPGDHNKGNPTPKVAGVIRATLSKVSGVPEHDISPNATIESLGIDSISAIKVAGLLRKQFVELSVGDILKAGTLREMAKRVEDQASASSIVDGLLPEQKLSSFKEAIDLNLILNDAGIQPHDTEDILPASAGQIYLLSMWQKTDGQIFMPTFQYFLRADCSAEDIERSWIQTTETHSILRTVFCRTADSQFPLVQVVLKKAANIFHAEGEFSNAAAAHQPMATLHAQKSGFGYHLKLRIHHALYDAVSLPLILRDFTSFLTKAQPTKSNIEFKDVLAESHGLNNSETSERFWRNYLNDAQPRTLRGPRTVGAQQRLDVFHPGLLSRTGRLERIAREQDVTVQALLFAAYAKVCHSRLANRDVDKHDIVLGIYLSNRTQLAGLEQLAAPTVNLLPLVVQKPGSKSMIDVAKKIHTDLREIGAKQHAGVALWELEQWTGVKVDTFVNFLKLPERGDEAESQLLEEVDAERRAARSRVLDASARRIELPRELRGFEAHSAYQHCIDMEIIIAREELDVGLFGPEEMVGLREAEAAILEFQRLLNELVDDAE